MTELSQTTAHEISPEVTLRRARGQNFVVDWIEGSKDASFVARSIREVMLIAWGDSGARLRHEGVDTVMRGRTIAILPAGETEVTLDGPSTLIRLSSVNALLDGLSPANSEIYARPDPAVAPPGAPSKALLSGVRLHSIDAIKAPGDKPRLKMLRSADLSINWVEYNGLRDRRALSPHDHVDFEQGSLAISGDFVHHLRVPWGPDATQWQDDRHVEAPAASLMVIPPRVIHTTEGLGEGHHILVDVFCPPRADFLANGWVANGQEYASG
ncbi:hypothetical protein [Bradyrhizobium liaoningense]